MSTTLLLEEIKNRWRNTLKPLYDDNRPAFNRLSIAKLGGVVTDSWETMITELFGRGALKYGEDIAQMKKMLDDIGCLGFYCEPGTVPPVAPQPSNNSILRLFQSSPSFLGTDLAETVFSVLSAPSPYGKQIWISIGETRLTKGYSIFQAHTYADGRNGLERFIRQLSVAQYTLSDLKIDLEKYGRGDIACLLPGPGVPDPRLSVERLLPSSSTPLHNLGDIWAALEVNDGFGFVWTRFAMHMVLHHSAMIGVFNPHTATKTSFVQALSSHGMTLEKLATLLDDYSSGQKAAALIRAGLVAPVQSHTNSNGGGSVGHTPSWSAPPVVILPQPTQQEAKSILITCATNQEMNAIIAMFKQHQVIIKQAVIVSKQCYQNLVTLPSGLHTLLTVCLCKSATETFLGEVDPGLTIIAGSVLGRRSKTKLGDLLVDECENDELRRIFKKINTKMVKQWSDLAEKCRPTTTKEWMKESILFFLYRYKEKVVSLKTVFDNMKADPVFLQKFATTYGGTGDVDAKLKEMIRTLKVELVAEVGEAGSLNLTDAARGVIDKYENELLEYPAPLVMEPTAHLGVCGITAAVDTNLDVIALRKRIDDFNTAQTKAGAAETKFVVVRSVNLYDDSPIVDEAFINYGAQVVAAWVYVFLDSFGIKVVA